MNLIYEPVRKAGRSVVPSCPECKTCAWPTSVIIKGVEYRKCPICGYTRSVNKNIVTPT